MRSLCSVRITDLLMNFSSYIETVDWSVNSMKLTNKSKFYILGLLMGS